MLRKNVWIVLVLVVVFLPSSLLAQEMMHGKWWQNKTMAAQLKLTTANEISWTKSILKAAGD